MKSLKKSITIFLFFALPVLLWAKSDPSGIEATNWRYSTGGESAATGDGFPILVKSAAPESADGGISLVADFSLPSGWDGPLGIVLYKNNMSCRVYVNDVYIDTLGRPGPDFFFQPYITRGVLVPQSILKESNTLSLELWNDTGTYKLRMMDFMDNDTYRTRMNRFNFLDIQLSRFACVILLFVCLYSLFLFINYRKRREILYLSLASLFFAIFLLNISAFDSSVPYLLLRSCLYACFPLSIFFIFQFFRLFFEMETSRRFMWIVAGVGLVFFVGYFFQRTTTALDSWHSIMLVYPVAAIAYGFVGGIKCLRAGKHNSIPTMLGLFVTLVLSGSDAFYFIGDITPMVLWQGIGFMCMIIGTFYSFSQEIADTNKKCELYADEMAQNKAQRDELFAKIRADAEKSESASSKLDRSIERVGTLMSQYLVSIDQINQNIGKQSDQVLANKTDVDRIFRAIGETDQLVGQHESLVQETVQNVRDLNDGISTTDRLVRQSGQSIRKLTEVSLSADRDVSESSRSVDDLANYSSNITEIVSSISNIAEQTNVLSINAAIEAARSGQMGKGFAVVAGEIRSLATKSGSSAAQINEIVSTMIEKIRNIQKQEAQVSRRLKDIVAENRTIEAAMDDVFHVLEEQQVRSASIAKAVDELVDTVRRIAEQTGAQRVGSEGLSKSLSLLESVTQAIVISSNEQRQCNDELKTNLESLKNVSVNNLDVVTDLKKLIS
jgi:methyl-accepting chemotaxis protein